MGGPRRNGPGGRSSWTAGARYLRRHRAGTDGTSPCAWAHGLVEERLPVSTGHYRGYRIDRRTEPPAGSGTAEPAPGAPQISS
ncbi:hypothetical protein GGE06_005631 [Streptomyces sp. SFB5A]|uniref:Uncharacterized protein n=1 Tax=Streptomyces nymphaeiformis TaxID=2663842 RepID=A0A7W7U449_9ACTN|nr:hypothetical protein [Streptomyces nymphaeiformis]